MIKKRFAKGNIYAAYLGLVGEDSSSDSINRLPITKAGNSHLRKLLVEAARGICKGQIGHKSKDLKARQYGIINLSSEEGFYVCLQNLHFTFIKCSLMFGYTISKET